MFEPGALGPWGLGALEPWSLGALEPWGLGALEPMYYLLRISPKCFQ